MYVHCRCLALRAIGLISTCRLKSSFVPWELSLPTKVAHGYVQYMQSSAHKLLIIQIPYISYVYICTLIIDVHVLILMTQV